MELVAKTTHVEEGLAQLAQQFHDKPVMAAFLTAFLRQVQDLENALFTIPAGNVLDVAVGVQLDGLGSIVGEPRDGRDDDTYRLWIRSRILLNMSSGLAEELYAIFAPLVAPAVPELEDFYPAALELRIQGEITEALASQLSLMLDEAKAAAVAAYLVWSVVPTPEILFFEEPVAFVFGATPATSTTFDVSGVVGTFPAAGPYYLLVRQELLSVDAFDGTTFTCTDETQVDHETGDAVYLAASGSSASATAGVMPVGGKTLPLSGISGTFPSAGPYLVYLESAGFALQVDSFDGTNLHLQRPSPVATGGEFVLHLDSVSSLGFGDVSGGGGGVFLGVVLSGGSATPFETPDTMPWLALQGQGVAPTEEEAVGITPTGPPI